MGEAGLDRASNNCRNFVAEVVMSTADGKTITNL